MKINLFEERLIIKPVSEFSSPAGIIQPQKYIEEVSLVGEVLNVGPDCSRTKKGDLVLFAKFATLKLPFRGTYAGCKLLNESDVLAIIEGGLE